MTSLDVRHLGELPTSLKDRGSDLWEGLHVTLDGHTAEVVGSKDVRCLLRLLQGRVQTSVERSEDVVDLLGGLAGDVARLDKVVVLLRDRTIGTALGDDGIDTIEQRETEP